MLPIGDDEAPKGPAFSPLLFDQVLQASKETACHRYWMVPSRVIRHDGAFARWFGPLGFLVLIRQPP